MAQSTKDTLKRGLAQMLKGGVIMDVTTADQAKVAEEAGAVAFMALERVPADIRAQGGVARMDDPIRVKEIMAAAEELPAPYDLVVEARGLGRLPLVNFAAGGIATPPDAALMMQLGCDGVFVGSGIFKSEDPARRARGIVDAVAHFNEPEVIARASEGLGEPMRGLDVRALPEKELLQMRSW